MSGTTQDLKKDSIIDVLSRNGVVDIRLSDDKQCVIFKEVQRELYQHALNKDEFRDFMNELGGLYYKMKWPDEDPNVYTTGPDYEY